MALIAAFIGYEFLAEMRLAGMPRKEIDIAIKSDCPGGISNILTQFAFEHRLDLKTGQSATYHKKRLVETDDDFHLSRWDAQIIISQYRTHCEEHEFCYSAYVEYKGWLSWTPPADADRLADDLTSNLKKSSCVKRATVTLTTHLSR